MCHFYHIVLQVGTCTRLHTLVKAKSRSVPFRNPIQITEYVQCCCNTPLMKSDSRVYCSNIYEPRYEKTGFLHMQKQRRRSASR